MATNIELERQIIALKTEVADLKSTLQNFFNYRFFEQPETRLTWDRLNKTAQVSAKEAATVIHETPATPTPAKDWLDTIQKYQQEHTASKEQKQ